MYGLTETHLKLAIIQKVKMDQICQWLVRIIFYTQLDIKFLDKVIYLANDSQIVIFPWKLFSKTKKIDTYNMNQSQK